MSQKLSILMPAIRPFLWEKLFDSIKLGCGAMPFELVIVAPTELPESLKKYQDSTDQKIIHVMDYGNPARAAKIALLVASGERIAMLSDDSTVVKNAFINMDKDYNDIPRTGSGKFLSMQYNENGCSDDPNYWRLKHHMNFQLDGIPDNAPVASMIYMEKQDLLDVGGWDCSKFECINWGGHDLMARMLNAGYNFGVSRTVYCMVDWAPGPAGKYNDHIPIHESDSQGRSNFAQLWKNHNPTRIKVPLHNWTEPGPLWKRRFK